jgi:choline dehydrogenase-like flavoprotein
LSDERDALGHLRTRLDWKISAHELETMRTYIEMAQQALAPVARLSPDPDLLTGDPAFLTRCDDSNHHMGGMRMSSDPATGIVDTNLRLHALTNTYICSGAVFPTSGFSNPTHTLLALAVRLAEHLS